MKTSLFLSLALSVAALGYLASCSSTEQPLPPAQLNERTPVPMDAKTRAAAESIKNFGLQFTIDYAKHNLTQSPGEQSAVSSPLSVAMVLSMLANCVDDATQEHITDYLGFSDTQTLNQFSHNLLGHLPSADIASKLSLANSIWPNTDFITNPVDSTFSLFREFYDAEVVCAPFSDPKTLGLINNWCARHTTGNIAQWKDVLDPFTLYIFLNALDFKSIWADDPFKKENSVSQPFFGLNETKNVNMMKAGMVDALYNENELCQYFKLYYGNYAFSFNLILPNESCSISDFTATLSPEYIENLETTSVNAKLNIGIPSFALTGSIDLSEFFDKTDHSILNSSQSVNLGGKKIPGHNIIYQQNLKFNLDETGVEASVVTSAEGIVLAPDPGNTYSVTVDRPFLFFINEYSTGTCILSGCIADL